MQHRIAMLAQLLLVMCFLAFQGNFALAGEELEPNDTSAQSQAISSGELLVGNTSSPTDLDWYAIDVAEAGKLTVQFNSSESDYDGWIFGVVDSSGNVLSATECRSSNCAGVGQQLAVGLATAGTYYVQVLSASSYSAPSGTYTFTATFAAGVGGVELEPNDTFSNANLILGGIDTLGQLSEPSDQDWFQFSVTKEGTLTVGFQSFLREYTGWKLSLLDQSLNVLANIECGGASCKDSGITLNQNLIVAGNYYIKVESQNSFQYPSSSYQLSINYSELPDIPVAPTISTVSQGQYLTKIFLNWADVQVGNTYAVQRSLNVDGPWEKLSEVGVKSFEDFAVASGVIYHYRVIARNISGVSETSESRSGFLGIAPRAVTDLNIGTTGATEMALSWTAPTDASGSNNAVVSYDLRYSDFPITMRNWPQATRVESEPTPIVPGVQENALINSLDPNTQYYVGLKFTDQRGFESEVSNVVSGTTGDLLTVSPGQIDVTLAKGEGALRTLTLTNISGDTSLNYKVTINTSAPQAQIGEVSNSAARSLQQQYPAASDFPTGFTDWIVKLKPSAGIQSSDPRGLVMPEDREEFKIKGELLGATLEGEIPIYGIQRWHISDVSQADLLSEFATDSRVEYIEPNYPVFATAVPVDDRFGELWGLKNTGQSAGRVGADISVVEAWDITQGSRDVVVAVIDSGIDYRHPDLRNNMWRNVDEVPDNGIDDDSNGFVDDYFGYDFANGDGNPLDDDGHGTHTAGTIGAEGNNSLGVVGVSQKVSLMAVKFLGQNRGTTVDAINAIYYAVDNGADILSNSWGGGGYSNALKEAIEYANSRGVLFIAAAGNDANNNDQYPTYPASYNVENVISVANTDRRDGRAYRSNYGRTTVDLGAPGTDILSTLPGNTYGSLSGTSMAAPHVSGVAALIKSLNPDLKAREIKSLILGNVDQIDSMNLLTATNGRLNAFKALSAVLPEWLGMVGPQSGTLGASQSEDLEISMQTLGLPSGRYTAEVVITLQSPYASSVVVPVNLDVGTASISTSDILLVPQEFAIEVDYLSDAIRVSWQAVAGADSYRVERSTSQDGEFTLLATAGTPSLDDDTALAETVYYYRVAAVYGAENGGYSEVIGGKRTAKVANLNLRLDSDVSSSPLGDDISYKLVATNQGPEIVAAPSLSFNVPLYTELVSATTATRSCVEIERSISCELQALNVGSSEEVVVVLRPLRQGAIMPIYLVAGSVDDPLETDTSDNSLLVVSNVIPVADLSVVLGLGSSQTTVIASIENAGPSVADNAVVEFSTGGQRVLRAQPSRGVCEVLGDVVRCELGALRAGVSAYVRVDFDDDAAGEILVSVISDQDPHQADNFSSAIVVAKDTDADGLSDSKEGELGTNPLAADTDGDGLLDGLEVNEYFTNPLQRDTDRDSMDDGQELDEGLNPLDGSDCPGWYCSSPPLYLYKIAEERADGDRDGLTNKVERALGTDSRNPDSDADGLTDGDEVNVYATNPLEADSDGDGFSDGSEVNTLGSDPLVADRDGDGLSDDVERELGTAIDNADTDADGLSDRLEVEIHKTDPLSADTDSDGLTDGSEIEIYGTNPLVFDTDKDSVGDGDEVNEGLDPLNEDDCPPWICGKPPMYLYKIAAERADSDRDGLTNKIEESLGTDSNNADSDADGLSDGLEVNTYNTDPLVADSDGDGLSDGAEVNTYKTQPLVKDTDGDSVDDGEEIQEGLDPLVEDCPAWICGSSKPWLYNINL